MGPTPGQVFIQEGGTPWHPDTVTDTFERLSFAAGLPPARLHDVRHARISQLIASGVDVRIISERVGHSGSQMTRDHAVVAADLLRGHHGKGRRDDPAGRKAVTGVFPGGLPTTPGRYSKRSVERQIHFR